MSAIGLRRCSDDTDFPAGAWKDEIKQVADCRVLFHRRGKVEKLWGFSINGRGDVGVELFQPAGGDALNAVERPGKLSGQRAGGVGVAAPVDHLHQAIFKTSGVEKTIKNRLNGVHDVAAGVAGPGLETEDGISRD